jgi:hypothetical protein
LAIGDVYTQLSQLAAHHHRYPLHCLHREQQFNLRGEMVYRDSSSGCSDSSMAPADVVRRMVSASPHNFSDPGAAAAAAAGPEVFSTLLRAGLDGVDADNLGAQLLAFAHTSLGLHWLAEQVESLRQASASTTSTVAAAASPLSLQELNKLLLAKVSDLACSHLLCCICCADAAVACTLRVQCSDAGQTTRTRYSAVQGFHGERGWAASG